MDFSTRRLLDPDLYLYYRYKMYLFDGWSFNLPVFETLAGQGVGPLHLGHACVPHLLVHEALQGQILILVFDFIPQVHLGGGGGCQSRLCHVMSWRTKRSNKPDACL